MIRPSAVTTGLLILAALVSALVCSVWATATTAASAGRLQGRLFTVSKGDVRLGIRTTGSLRPKDSLPVATQITGKIEWLIDEGTRVKAGDIVARVDDVEYREELDDAVSNLSIVKTDLALEELRRDYTERQRERDIQRCRMNLELAQLVLSDLGQHTPTDVRLSELDLELKRVILDAAANECQRLEGLAAKGIVDQHQISVVRLKLEGARVAHAKAVLEHDQILAPTPAEDLAVARQQVERARIALDLALKKKDRDVNLCRTAVALEQAMVDRYLQLIDVQQRRVADAQVAAPIDGTVLYPRDWGTPPLLGDQIWRGNRIVDIADIDSMTVRALVNQVDWPYIKPGQRAEVVLAAAPEVSFTGTVLNVGGLASDRYLTMGGDVTGVMTFPVTVLIDQKSPLLRPTYSAHLNIITQDYKDVCWVPRIAVDHDGAGKPIVWVRQAGATVSRPVELGPQDAVRIVVTAGLQPGDVVLVPLRK